MNSPRRPRRRLLAAASALAAGPLLASCAGGGAEPAADSGTAKGSWSFKDDRAKVIKADGPPKLPS